MKKLFIVSVILAMLTSMTAYADTKIKAVADSDTHMVTVSGDMGTSNANKRVVITVLSKGMKVSDMELITSENIKESILGMYMAYTDEDGKYEANFKMDSQVGEYVVVVSGPDKGEKFDTVFFNPEDIADIMKNLELARKNKDANEIMTILSVENNLRSLGIGKLTDETYGVKITDLNVSSFEILANYDKPYELAATFLDAYRETCAVKAFNTIASKDDVLYLIEECDDILGIMSTKAYAIYDKLQDKSSVDTKMQSGGFVSKDSITKRFCDTVYLYSIDKMQNWSEFAPFVEENNDYLKLDLSDYTNLKYPSDVDKKIAGNAYSSVEELRTAFKKAVQSIEDEESEKKSSGGSKVSSYTAPIVTPQAPLAPSVSQVNFNDIDTVSWAKDAILSLASKKIVNGKADGMFYPNDTVTREEIAKILVEAFGIDKNDAACDFSDVDSSHWSYAYIAAAKKSGIVNGYADGTFGLGSGVTRQELAAMIYRTAKANGIIFADGKKAEFADSEQIAGFAKDAVDVLSGAGIINGKGDGLFAPAHYCTRAEAAKIVYSVLNIK